MTSEAANRHPPLLGRGRSFGSFAARLGIRLPRPPRSETKLFRPSMLRVRDPAAAPDWLLGASPLLCRGRSRGARLLSRAVVGPVLRSLGRGAACSADGPRRGRAAGAREWTPTNGLHAWRMWPVHIATALTRQVIQRRCHRTFTIVRIGMSRPRILSTATLKLRYLLNR